MVPFAYMEGRLEARGCSGVVQIMDCQTGEVVQEYPRHTQARILIDGSCYEGPGTDLVEQPRALGKMARKLQELSCLPVETRPLDLYAELAEVAR